MRKRDHITMLVAAMAAFCLSGCEDKAPSTSSTDKEATRDEEATTKPGSEPKVPATKPSDAQPTTKQDNQKKAPSTDITDPEVVAEAFILAISKNNAEEAAQYVHPEYREEFKKALEKGVPPIPENPEIVVKVKSNGNEADVMLLNAQEPASGGPPFGLDMELHNGKWWIVK